MNYLVDINDTLILIRNHNNDPDENFRVGTL